MRVPFIDLKPTPKLHGGIVKTLDEVIKNGVFIAGRFVHQFEEEFAQYLSAKNVISLNSGTDALILGLQALDLPAESEVLVAANTFFSAGYAIAACGHTPVFVDIDPSDYGMSLVDLESKITSKTRAVIVTHLYGQPDKIDEIKNIIKGRDISLIEDAAQAHGAYYKNKRVGTIGDCAAFSFYPTKNLGAYGDGGAIATQNVALAKKIRLLCNYGQTKKYHHDILGTNSRLDALQAAFLVEKLRSLDELNTKRQTHAELYTKLLTNVKEIYTPPTIAGRKSVYHLYVIQAKKRDVLQKYLSQRGVETLIHYPIPLHLQKAFAYLGYKKGDLPRVEKVSRNILSLPLYPDIHSSQIEYICQNIKENYRT